MYGVPPLARSGRNSPAHSFGAERSTCRAPRLGGDCPEGEPGSGSRCRGAPTAGRAHGSAPGRVPCSCATERPRGHGPPAWAAWAGAAMVCCIGSGIYTLPCGLACMIHSKIQSAGLASASEQFSSGVKRSGLNFGMLTRPAGWRMKRMKRRGCLKRLWELGMAQGKRTQGTLWQPGWRKGRGRGSRKVVRSCTECPRQHR